MMAWLDSIGTLCAGMLKEGSVCRTQQLNKGLWVRQSCKSGLTCQRSQNLSLGVPNLAFFLSSNPEMIKLRQAQKILGVWPFVTVFLFSEKTNQKCEASPYVWVNKLLSPSVPALQPGMLQNLCLHLCLFCSFQEDLLSGGGTFNLHLLITLWINYHGEGKKGFWVKYYGYGIMDLASEFKRTTGNVSSVDSTEFKLFPGWSQERPKSASCCLLNPVHPLSSFLFWTDTSKCC